MLCSSGHAYIGCAHGISTDDTADNVQNMMFTVQYHSALLYIVRTNIQSDSAVHGTAVTSCTLSVYRCQMMSKPVHTTARRSSLADV